MGAASDAASLAALCTDLRLQGSDWLALPTGCKLTVLLPLALCCLSSETCPCAVLWLSPFPLDGTFPCRLTFIPF